MGKPPGQKAGEKLLDLGAEKEQNGRMKNDANSGLGRDVAGGEGIARDGCSYIESYKGPLHWLKHVQNKTEVSVSHAN